MEPKKSLYDSFPNQACLLVSSYDRSTRYRGVRLCALSITLG
jgi:hypothetical protein